MTAKEYHDTLSDQEIDNISAFEFAEKYHQHKIKLAWNEYQEKLKTVETDLEDGNAASWLRLLTH